MSSMMTLTQCMRRAQDDNASDTATFDLVGPIGRLHCRWLDACFEMFVEVGKEKGFFMVRQFDLPDVWVENYQPNLKRAKA
jgi:hypothetical protein